MLLDEIIQAINTAWVEASTGFILYFAKGPQTKPGTPINYPFVVFNIIDSPKTYAMRSDQNETPQEGNHIYGRIRIQFDIWCNEEQFSTGMTINNTLIDTFKFNNLTLTTSKNIGTYPGNERVTFFSEGQKVYKISNDFIFVVGI